MGHIYVKYKYKNEVVSSDFVKENKILFDPRSLNSKEKTDAILKLRKLDGDNILYIDEFFNLTTEPIIL